MSHLDWNKLDPKLRERIIQSDPEGFNAGGIRPGARQVRPSQLQPHQGRALDSGAPKKEASRGRMARGGPVIRVTFISLRRRIVTDDDNDRTGYKELRDCIARFFGLDDERNTIAWEYTQAQTRGEQETLVRIEIL